MEPWCFDFVAEAVKYFEAVETPTDTTKVAIFTPEIGPITFKMGPNDNRPNIKWKTRNRKALPNMKIDPSDKQVKDLHIDININLTGKEGQRAS